MKTVLTVASWILFAGSLAAAESASAWLAFPAGLNYDLTEQAGAASVRIPVAPQPKAPPVTNLQARLRDVVFHNGRQEAISPTFQADFDGGDAHHGPSLVVQAKALATFPGSYVISLDIFRSNIDTNQSEPLQTVTLTLQRPAPDIALGPPVVVNQVWWFGHGSAEASLLTLEERSGKSSLTGVQFTPAPDPMPGNGTLEVLLSNNVVPARTAVQAAIRARGTFPLGKSTGKIQIRARELEQPLVASYEVHSRRTPVWIALLVTLGFTIGYLVRHVLHDRQDIATALVAASDALKALNDTLIGIDDGMFRETVGRLKKTLIEAARGNLAATIQTAATKALQDLSVAQKEVAERVSRLHEMVQPLYACLHQKWQLPASLQPRLLAAVAGIDAIAKLVECQNAQAGLARLDLVLGEELLNLVNALGKWQNEAGRYFTDLNDVPPPLKEPGRVREATAGWTNQFGAATANYPAVSAAQVCTALSVAHIAYGNALSIADYVSESANKVIQSLEDFCSAHGVLNGDSLADVKAVSLRAAAPVKTDLDHPGDAQADLPGRHHAVIAAWQTFLVSLIPAGADAKPIKDALASNQWMQAMNTAAALIQNAAPQPGAGVPLALAVIAKTAISMPGAVAGSIVFTAAPVSPDGTSLLFLPRKPVLSGNAVERDYFMRQAEEASLWQSAIFGALFAAIAYALYEKAWVGTLYEMLGIFIWAFGVDISSDAVMNAAKKIKLPDA